MKGEFSPLLPAQKTNDYVCVDLRERENVCVCVKKCLKSSFLLYWNLDVGW